MGLRIHILGASGTGTSTLGRTLANRLGTQQFETDDFLWLPTDPPFQHRRPVADRVRLMEDMFLPRADWILSGSVTCWAEAITPRLTHVIFLSAPATVRLARIRARERQRHGARIAPGGAMSATHRAFLDYAMAYDDPGFTGTTRALHETWLATLPIPVLRLDATESTETLAASAAAALGSATEAAVSERA